MLLSTDSISKRKFTVAGGLIVSAYNHLWQPDNYRGSGGVVQLIPFNDTPNPGGVYKAWATPVDKYDIRATGNKFGFVAAFSKTDNFKILDPHVNYCIDVLKYKDECWNGVLDDGHRQGDRRLAGPHRRDAGHRRVLDVGPVHAGQVLRDGPGRHLRRQRVQPRRLVAHRASSSTVRLWQVRTSTITVASTTVSGKGKASRAVNMSCVSTSVLVPQRQLPRYRV